MELLSRSLGISDRTHWLGQHSDVEGLFQACDASVLPSVGEAFGNVAAEAMACGVPVVASRSGASEETVEHGRTGLLAAPCDPASFADALQTLAGNPALRKEMGRNAIERVSKLFTLDRAVGNTIQVYESVWAGQEA